MNELQITEIIALIKMLPKSELDAYLSRLHDIAASAGGSGRQREEGSINDLFTVFRWPYGFLYGFFKNRGVRQNAETLLKV